MWVGHEKWEGAPCGRGMRLVYKSVWSDMTQRGDLVLHNPESHVMCFRLCAMVDSSKGGGRGE